MLTAEIRDSERADRSRRSERAMEDPVYEIELTRKAEHDLFAMPVWLQITVEAHLQRLAQRPSALSRAVVSPPHPPGGMISEFDHGPIDGINHHISVFFQISAPDIRAARSANIWSGSTSAPIGNASDEIIQATYRCELGKRRRSTLWPVKVSAENALLTQRCGWTASVVGPTSVAP
jgi:hypothetical protein